MSSPSSAICPSVIVAEAIKSAVIGDVQEPYGATFCSGIVLLLTPGPRLPPHTCRAPDGKPRRLRRIGHVPHQPLPPDSAPAFTFSHWEYTCTRLACRATLCRPTYLPQPSPPNDSS